MIARIVYNAIADNFSTQVKKKSTLFLERGVGNKNVVVKNLTTKNPIKSINGMRFSKIYILINGWTIDVGMSFAKDVSDYLSKMRGPYIDGADTLLIKESIIEPFPYVLDDSRTDSSQIIVFGIGFYYIE